MTLARCILLRVKLALAYAENFVLQARGQGDDAFIVFVFRKKVAVVCFLASTLLPSRTCPETLSPF